MLLKKKTVLNYLNTKHNMLAWQNKKIKLDKLHIFILVIFICLVIYFTPRREWGDGGQNPTPGSGACVLGHNPNLDFNERSNIESNSDTLKKARLQRDMAA